MAVSLTIHDVANKTRDVVASRAAASESSLLKFLDYELPERAAPPAVSDAIRGIRLRARATPEAQDMVKDLAADRR